MLPRRSQVVLGLIGPLLPARGSAGAGGLQWCRTRAVVCRCTSSGSWPWACFRLLLGSVSSRDVLLSSWRRWFPGLRPPPPGPFAEQLVFQTGLQKPPQARDGSCRRCWPCLRPRGPRPLPGVTGWLLWGPRSPVKHRCGGWGKETERGLPESDPGCPWGRSGDTLSVSALWMGFSWPQMPLPSRLCRVGLQWRF